MMTQDEILTPQNGDVSNSLKLKDTPPSEAESMNTTQADKVEMEDGVKEDEPGYEKPVETKSIEELQILSSLLSSSLKERKKSKMRSIFSFKKSLLNIGNDDVMPLGPPPPRRHRHRSRPLWRRFRRILRRCNCLRSYRRLVRQGQRRQLLQLQIRLNQLHDLEAEPPVPESAIKRFGRRVLGALGLWRPSPVIPDLEPRNGPRLPGVRRRQIARNNSFIGSADHYSMHRSLRQRTQLLELTDESIPPRNDTSTSHSPDIA